MRIALFGSVVTQIPPSGQAAIERLVYYQAWGLAERQHKILLFAPTGSHVDHQNVEIIEVGSGGTLTGEGWEKESELIKKIGSSYKLRLEIANLGMVVDQLIERKNDFDIVLNNLRGEAVMIPVAAYLNKPFVHVMHLPLFDELVSLFKRYNTALISISNAQRKAYPDLNYVATVYNAVDTKIFTFSPSCQDYYLYLGSIGKNKNPAEAIKACKKANVKLLIGGRIKDKDYYDKEIAHFIDGKQIVWVGELSQEKIIELYQGARAFLFPVLWEEPFGLVMIEAMATGCPVVAYPNGAVPEVVVDGKTGFLVNNVEEMAEKIKFIEGLESEKMKDLRANCRRHVEENFTIDKMIDGYEEVLKKIVCG